MMLVRMLVRMLVMLVVVMMYSPRMSGWLMESSISVQALRALACWNAVRVECGSCGMPCGGRCEPGGLP
jgi:hypothetical protein